MHPGFRRSGKGFPKFRTVGHFTENGKPTKIKIQMLIRFLCLDEPHGPVSLLVRKYKQGH